MSNTAANHAIDKMEGQLAALSEDRFREVARTTAQQYDEATGLNRENLELVLIAINHVADDRWITAANYTEALADRLDYLEDHEGFTYVEALYRATHH